MRRSVHGASRDPSTISRKPFDLGVEVVDVVQDERLDGLGPLRRAPLQLSVMADDAVKQLLELGFGERRQFGRLLATPG